ncbi:MULTISPECIES: hypothetical protein [unclassified Streptomyces]|uniref:hypothetical protein n=1 Tax=unclassified Streptomyces TaxID=2593676 RepID=UPI001319F2FC|nr:MULTISPECIES: hypothetical protein [unclassified Streptomyces]MYX38063.1 hypothetical protein [Streptomyces sp. SID8377]
MLDAAGDPDATTGPLPAIYAYGDLQLGFSKGGILWHLALEPSGREMVLPGPLGVRNRVKNFTLQEFMDIAKAAGERVGKCEPFVSGESWWQISGSGVFADFDEEGLMVAAHYSDQRFAN